VGRLEEGNKDKLFDCGEKQAWKESFIINIAHEIL